MPTMMNKFYTEEEFLNTPISEMVLPEVDMTSWYNPMSEEEAEQAIAEFDAKWFAKAWQGQTLDRGSKQASKRRTQQQEKKEMM